MECFEGIFACATNLPDTLDRASRRRFDLTLRFAPLNARQRWRMLRQVCAEVGVAVPDGRTRRAAALRRHVARLAGATAGDFAAVARRGHLVGLAEPTAIAQAVQGEVALRGRTRRVGFGVR